MRTCTNVKHSASFFSPRILLAWFVLRRSVLDEKNGQNSTNTTRQPRGPACRQAGSAGRSTCSDRCASILCAAAGRRYSLRQRNIRHEVCAAERAPSLANCSTHGVKQISTYPQQNKRSVPRKGDTQFRSGPHTRQHPRRAEARRAQAGSTRNSESNRNSRNSFKTNDRCTLYPKMERGVCVPDASAGRLGRQNVADKTGRPSRPSTGTHNSGKGRRYKGKSEM